jgi:hypothetical protein
MNEHISAHVKGVGEPASLRDRIDRLRAERAALRIRAEARQRLVDQDMAQATRLTLEILELEEMLARRTGNPEPFP